MVSVLQKLCAQHSLILAFLPPSFSPSLPLPPSLPSSLPLSLPSQVDLQKSLRSLDEKEKELRMSRASLREKEAVLQVGHEESLLGPLHVLTCGKAGTLVPVMSLPLCVSCRGTERS